MTTHKPEKDPDSPPITFSMGLSEKEKQDLEQMISEFQQEDSSESVDFSTIKKQIEALNKRMAYLTSMFLTIDQSLKPLSEVVRLTLEKCELLNQRINTIIDSIRTGEPL